MDEGLLNDLLECSVCLERLDTSSRVLPCQHTFCIKCLKEIVQSHKELRCPECRVLVDVRVEELPPNVLLMRILEGMRGRGGGGGGNTTPSKPSANQSQPISSPINPSVHHQQQKLMMPYNHSVTSRQKDGSNVVTPFQDPNNLSNSRIGPSQAQQGRIQQQQQDSTRQHMEYVINNSTPYGRAVCDYLPKDPSNLCFKKGDIILLRKRIDTHWFYGESGGKQGTFPVSYIQVIIPLPVLPPPQCKALYDFRMAAPDEDGCLAFDKGALITVIRRVDENWAEGRLNERIGIFPIAFVEMNASARALMKISNTIGAQRSAPVAPHTEPIMGVSMLQPTRMDQQVPNTYRQQQMSLSSPAPALGPTPPGPHPMSQSQPLLSNHHPQQQQQQPHPPTNIPQQSSSGAQQTDSFNEPDVIQLVYGNRVNAAQILIQNTQANKPNTDASSAQANLAGQEAYMKARANIMQFQSMSSSYHATNNLSSDSSSSTTTPSFGGSSVTTTPNTSSSNTSSSESNTPSSPASPATSAAQARSNTDKNIIQQNQSATQNNYCNVIPVVKQTPSVQPSAAVYTNVTIEDPNTSNRSHESSLESSGNTSVLNTSNHSLLNADINRINISNNSPVQNISVESPPRSNMSSPQTGILTANIPPTSSSTIIHSHSEMKCAQQSASAGIYQVPTNNREIMQYSNSGYTLLTNTQSGSMSNPFLTNQSVENTMQKDDHTTVLSPRHGVMVATPRSGYQSHHHREKRHSLTSGGQTLAPQQNSTPNRHSMEYMLSGNNIAPVTPRTGPATSTEGQTSQFFGDGIRKSDAKREREKEVKLPAPYVALYPYKPQKGDELELKKGATYMVMERCYDGWYKGCLNNNPQKCGVFPGNYVVPAHAKSKHRSSKGSNSADAKTSASKSGGAVTGPTSIPSRKGDGAPGEAPTSTTQSSTSTAQPPDLPPRAASPNNSSFPWSSSSKPSASSSKSSEKSKEKSKSEKTPSSMSFMKRLAAMKKCKSPPPSSSSNSSQNPGFSMDNPVFEDCSVPAQHPVQPVHVRSGSCPSQLLQPENVEASPAGPHATVGPAGAARLLNSSRAAHTLGPAHAAGPRVRARPSLANATLTAPPQHVGQRSTNDGPWHPIATSNNRPQHQHRKSHSLDAGQQLRTRDSTTTRERFRCIVPYPPNSEYELELQVDDVVVVHRKWGDGWYKGTHERTGRTGLFPASFVEAC